MEGPWEKFKQNPILASNSHWKCPGHGTAVESGGQWYYLYHAYHENGFPNLGRSTLLSQISWNTDSGWPAFSIDSIKPDPTVMHTNFKDAFRSEEHTSELQSLMRISYAVFCLKKKK